MMDKMKFEMMRGCGVVRSVVNISGIRLARFMPNQDINHGVETEEREARPVITVLNEPVLCSEELIVAFAPSHASVACGVVHVQWTHAKKG